jgi:hypothetical protein
MKSTRRSWLLVCLVALVMLRSLWGTNAQAHSAVSESPSSLSFGSVSVNALSSPQGFTVMNIGSQRITIQSVASSSSQFKVTGPSLPLAVSPGQGVSFQVLFQPTSAGNFSGSINVYLNRYLRAKSVAVSGTGLTSAQNPPPPAPTYLLSASANSLNLGSLLVGASGSQSIVLTNTGNSSVSISQVAVTGAGFTAGGFAVPLTLTAGQNATLTVAFSPVAAGNVTGSVSVISNATNSPTTIALTGSGIAPTRILSPSVSSLSFGNILVGKTSSPQTVSITNSGNSSVTISQFTVSGAAFTAGGLTVPATLAAGQSASLTLSFTPSAAGTVSGSVSVVSNATNSPTTIALSGSGTAQTLQLTPSVTSLSFGNVLVGSTSSSQTVSISNTGNGSVTISQLTTVGTSFTAAGIALPLTLAAGQTTSMTVAFSPTALASVSGSVSVVSNATNSPTTISLTGTGVQPQISVVPSSVAFGNATVGTSDPQTMTIRNTGTANLSLTQATLSGQGFVLSGLSLPLTVAAGGSAPFTLSFTPTSASNFSASLSLTSNAPGSPLTVALTGTGLAPTLQLSVSPSSLSFGSETVGTSGSQTIAISNSGNSSVSVSQIAVSGAAYSVTGVALPLSLSAGQSSSFAVVFAPTSTGSLPGSISIVSTAANSPTTIALSGSGAQAVSHYVSLSWSDATTGLAGYNLYRGTTSGGPYAKINSALVPTAAYTDSAVQSGATYYYVSTAVDSTGVESTYSNEAAAVIP